MKKFEIEFMVFGLKCRAKIDGESVYDITRRFEKPTSPPKLISVKEISESENKTRDESDKHYDFLKSFFNLK